MTFTAESYSILVLGFTVFIIVILAVILSWPKQNNNDKGK